MVCALQRTLVKATGPGELVAKGSTRLWALPPASPHCLPPSSGNFPPSSTARPFSRTRPGTHSCSLFHQQPINKPWCICSATQQDHTINTMLGDPIFWRDPDEAVIEDNRQRDDFLGAGSTAWWPQHKAWPVDGPRGCLLTSLIHCFG